MPRFVKIKDYAALSKVQQSVLYNRINKGHIILTDFFGPDGSKSSYIDTEMYPPEKAKIRMPRKKFVTGK